VGYLRKHVDAVHNMITHPCPYCSYVGTTKSNLKRHKDSKHDELMKAEKQEENMTLLPHPVTG